MNDRDLAAALGHETEAMARLYAKGADLRKSMSDIPVRFEKEITCGGDCYSAQRYRRVRLYEPVETSKLYRFGQGNAFCTVLRETHSKWALKCAYNGH
ncbi:hypothetical protein PsW74_03759 [Pseudovibrio sp. W74]|nr:hypothetical protein PsW74_03759 [Pseudovibrio sp. W74]